MNYFNFLPVKRPMIVPHPYDACTLKNMTKRGNKYLSPLSFAAAVAAVRAQTKYKPKPAHDA